MDNRRDYDAVTITVRGEVVRVFKKRSGDIFRTGSMGDGRAYIDMLFTAGATAYGEFSRTASLEVALYARYIVSKKELLQVRMVDVDCPKRVGETSTSSYAAVVELWK